MSPNVPWRSLVTMFHILNIKQHGVHEITTVFGFPRNCEIDTFLGIQVYFSLRDVTCDCVFISQIVCVTAGDISICLCPHWYTSSLVCLQHCHLWITINRYQYNWALLILVVKSLFKKASKGKFLYSAASSPQDSSKHFTLYLILTDLFTQTPSRLLWEASSHMLQLMCEGYSYTYPPLSVARYSCIQLSELEQRRANKLAQGFNTAAQVSNPDPISRESEALPWATFNMSFMTMKLIDLWCRLFWSVCCFYVSLLFLHKWNLRINMTLISIHM